MSNELTAASIQKQIDELLAKKKEIELKEKSGAIEQIKNLMRDNNVTPEDLGFGGAKRKGGKPTGDGPKFKLTPGTYENKATGEKSTYGGRGRWPKFLKGLSEEQVSGCKVA